MYLKIFGGILIIAGCGGFGFSIAAAHSAQLRGLQQLQQALDFMQCELQYHLTPLPALCRETAAQCSGELKRLFAALAQELEDQISPDVASCMANVLEHSTLPDVPANILQTLGMTLGRFDLQGQVKAFEAARQSCRMHLTRLGENFQIRQRSYQTLSLCAGAALAILFL